MKPTHITLYENNIIYDSCILLNIVIIVK